jgi:hypothetical protein
MRHLVLFLNRYSNWKLLTGLVLLYVLFSVVLLGNAEKKINTLAGQEIGPIDLIFGFNPGRTLDMVEAYGDAGRAYYSEVEITIDIGYPIIYALLFAVIITLIYKKLNNQPVLYLNMLPFVAMFFDFLENLTIVSMLTHYPEQSMLMATLCEIFKLIKWLLFGLIIFVIIFGFIKMIMKR